MFFRLLNRAICDWDKDACRLFSILIDPYADIRLSTNTIWTVFTFQVEKSGVALFLGSKFFLEQQNTNHCQID
jgi:hypothetical protein